MTVEEYRKLPKDDGPFYHELRHGELVAVPRPKIGHHLGQNRLADLLRLAAGPRWYASTELAFRALPEYELRDGPTVTWPSGQEIPQPLFANARLPVDDIFA